MFLDLLKMLGKGPPQNNRDSFTRLSATATPGKVYAFTAKATIENKSAWYYFKFISRMGY